MTYRIILTKNPFPIHISYNPDSPLRNAGIRENAKVLSAALSAALMKTWMLLDQPEQYSGGEVIGAEVVPLNWAAGIPMFGSWLNAKKFVFSCHE